MGIEPTTLSLGSVTRGAWLSGIRAAKPKRYRSKPLETAPGGSSLARNWRALGVEGRLRRRLGAD